MAPSAGCWGQPCECEISLGYGKRESEALARVASTTKFAVSEQLKAHEKNRPKPLWTPLSSKIPNVADQLAGRPGQDHAVMDQTKNFDDAIRCPVIN